MDINTQPASSEPQYSRKRAFILTIAGILIIIFGTALIIFINNIDNIFPLLPEKHFEPATYKRTLVGPPPMSFEYTIGEKKSPIFGHIFTVETEQMITEEQAASLEKAVDGTFCGGSAFSNVYFLCLHVAAGNLAEYKQKLTILSNFEFVTGVGPSSAQLMSHN